ncbi:unnamed protein product [Porites evermanni]|uniref:Transmembrane protein 242 n=1 Tax=Porites evermanni TaxID=104178 RepID=A0ABN8QQN9_9CNID|nr:unnamed protein product [Porites evermanni]
MALNGQPLTKFARHVIFAAGIGAGGSVLVNTVRRDGERAKKILCYTAVSGLTGLSIGSTYAAFRKQGVLTYSFSTGASFFTISGLFFVIRDNLLLSSKAHDLRRSLDQLQGNPTLTTRREAMTGMQASSLSGGAVGMLLSCAIWRGFGVLFLNIVQGALMAAAGQWTVNKCHIWILEETIKYHYPELVANAKRNEESWEQWFVRKLSGRSYGSQVKEKLRSYEIQLQLLEEEEARLLRLIEEQQSKSLDRTPEKTTSGLESLQRIENDL